MELPKIETRNLPEQSQLTGVFGSQKHPSPAAGSDDSIVNLMAFIYQLV